MLFRRSMPPQCATCARASHLSEGEMICSKCGVVSPNYQCRGYRYDPLKRKPERHQPLKTHGEEHFTLD